MEKDQRRSPRVMFNIPLTITGIDDQGRPFEAEGRTITLNRHGARVQVAQPLNPGQTVRVVNQINEEEADFQVIGPISPRLDRLGEWGIKCLEEDRNIWDIAFPSIGEAVDAHVLVECRQCHTLALEPLSLVEVEVLETAGLFSKLCSQCQVSTPWGYPLRVFEVDSKSYPMAAADTGTTPPLPENRRRTVRKPLQLPARLRNYYGESEIIQTENLSQEGFCFSSARKYLVGQGILVICPFSGDNERPEVRARIVREERLGDGDRHFYGVRLDPPLR